jgi:hypothetical protein
LISLIFWVFFKRQKTIKRLPSMQHWKPFSPKHNELHEPGISLVEGSCPVSSREKTSSAQASSARIAPKFGLSDLDPQFSTERSVIQIPPRDQNFNDVDVEAKPISVLSSLGCERSDTATQFSIW